MIVKVTDDCVHCLKKKAVKWGGIWQEGDQKAIAGWCLEHWKTVGIERAIGAMNLPEVARLKELARLEQG